MGDSQLSASELRRRHQAASLFQSYFIVGVNAARQRSWDTPISHDDIKVLWRYRGEDGAGEETEEEKAQIQQMLRFCFPESQDELQKLRSPSRPSDFFTFVLTKEDGGRIYGFCQRMLPLGPGRRHDISARLPECHCFLSSFKYHSLFRALLPLMAFARWRSPHALRAAVARLNKVRKQGRIGMPIG